MAWMGKHVEAPSGLEITFLMLQRHPFWGTKKLSAHDRKEAGNQSVPSLAELLKEAADLNLSIMFDLRRPPRNHTYHDTFVNQTLEAVLSSRVPQTMVMLPSPPVPLVPLHPAATLPSPGHGDSPSLAHTPHSVLKPLCSVPTPGMPRPSLASCPSSQTTDPLASG